MLRYARYAVTRQEVAYMMPVPAITRQDVTKAPRVSPRAVTALLYYARRYHLRRHAYARVTA